MSAEEIKFPPSERKDPRRFEVPPWEQKQFDELQARLEAEKAAEQAAEAQRAAAAVAAAGAVSAAGTVEPEPTEWEPSLPASRPDELGTDRVAAPATEASPAEPESPAVEMMMAQLAAQEQEGAKPVQTVSIVSGVLLAVIGCVLVVWAVAAFVASRRAGAVGAFGGAVLLLFGAGFVAGGVWIGTKHLR